MNKTEQEIISEFYSKMGKKSAAARRKKIIEKAKRQKVVPNDVIGKLRHHGEEINQ